MLLSSTPNSTMTGGTDLGGTNLAHSDDLSAHQTGLVQVSSTPSSTMTGSMHQCVSTNHPSSYLTNQHRLSVLPPLTPVVTAATLNLHNIGRSVNSGSLSDCDNLASTSAVQHLVAAGGDLVAAAANTLHASNDSPTQLGGSTADTITWGYHPYASLPVKADSSDSMATNVFSGQQHSSATDNYVDAAAKNLLSAGYYQGAMYPSAYASAYNSTNAYHPYSRPSALSASQYAALPYLASANTGSTPYYGNSYSSAAQSSLDYAAYAAYNPTAYYGTYGTSSTNVPTTSASYSLGSSPLASAASASLVESAAGLLPVSGEPPLLTKATKSESKKSKSKKKKAVVNAATCDAQYERVFIWDLDDTVCVLRALMSGGITAKSRKDGCTSMQYAMAMDEVIYQMAETQLCMNELDDCDQVHIDDVTTEETLQQQQQQQHDASYGSGSSSSHNVSGGSDPTTASSLPDQSASRSPNQSALSSDQFNMAAAAQSSAGIKAGNDWMKRLSLKYKQIRDVYNLHRQQPDALLRACGKYEHWHTLRSNVDALTECWTSQALRSMLLIASKSRYANVLISSDPLVLALCRSLLFDLSPAVPPENIYSYAKIGRDACMERISNRFGKKCTYVVVSTSALDEQAAKQHSIPFWRISSMNDLNALHHAVDLGHL